MIYCNWMCSSHAPYLILKLLTRNAHVDFSFIYNCIGFQSYNYRGISNTKGKDDHEVKQMGPKFQINLVNGLSWFQTSLIDLQYQNIFQNTKKYVEIHINHQNQNLVQIFQPLELNHIYYGCIKYPPNSSSRSDSCMAADVPKFIVNNSRGRFFEGEQVLMLQYAGIMNYKYSICCIYKIK